MVLVTPDERRRAFEAVRVTCHSGTEASCSM